MPENPNINSSRGEQGSARGYLPASARSASGSKTKSGSGMGLDLTKAKDERAKMQVSFAEQFSSSRMGGQESNRSTKPPPFWSKNQPWSFAQQLDSFRDAPRQAPESQWSARTPPLDPSSARSQQWSWSARGQSQTSQQTQQQQAQYSWSDSARGHQQWQMENWYWSQQWQQWQGSYSQEQQIQHQSQSSSARGTGNESQRGAQKSAEDQQQQQSQSARERAEIDHALQQQLDQQQMQQHQQQQQQSIPEQDLQWDPSQQPEPVFHEGRYVAYRSKVKNLAGSQLRAPFASDYPEDPTDQGPGDMPPPWMVQYPRTQQLPPVGNTQLGQRPLPTAPNGNTKTESFLENRHIAQACYMRDKYGSQDIFNWK